MTLIQRTQNKPPFGTSRNPGPHVLQLLQILNNPPASPEDVGPRIRKKRTLYPVERYPEAIYAAILRCSRQISDEFQEALSARQPIRDFRLDCIIKDNDVVPTWVLLPCPGTREIGDSEVDFRLFDVGHGRWSIP